MLGNFIRRKLTPIVGFFASTVVATSAVAEADPYLWLEKVESKRSLDWVRKQNNSCSAFMQSQPTYAGLRSDIDKILFANDKVPFARNRRGFFYNFWQDANSKHGLIRRTTLDEYRTTNPKWDVILDLDKLSAAENENWVYKGSTNFEHPSSRVLLQLSRGGKDAVVIREFDTETRTFVEDGFNVPEAKSWLTPLDENQVFLATALDANDTTTAGYPKSIKLWKRGQPIESAQTVFSIERSDALASVNVFLDGKAKHAVFSREIDFYHIELSILESNGQNRKLPLPITSTLLDIDGGYIYSHLKEDLKLSGRTLPTNTVIRIPLEATDLENAEVIFTADPSQTIENISVTRAGVYVTILDNVRNKILLAKPSPAGVWSTTTLPLPDTGVLTLEARNDRDPHSIPTVTYTDYLTPQTQYLLHDQDGSYRIEKLKAAPEQFDARNLEVKQHFSTSADGTKVPYFIIHQKGLKLNGKNPTMLYGYGGFQISLTPAYSGVIGKAWLERGGVYVVANIRGGGEFGPSWHKAALKHNRQRAYDDFISVAEHLIATKVTSPSHLGIAGGSNGGLLVGAVMVQRPDLFNAVLCKVPLLDMVRYPKLLAGALWIGEYGDPTIKADLDYILTYSPYQNLRADRKYPVPFFTTSTKDDRVHPGHARKFAARMAEMGHPFYFYENINGGHAGSGNLEEKAHMSALEYTYLWNQLK